MKRLDYIDTAKGICMLLIMLGHCATGTSARDDMFLITWIYSFHTTTFFIITGMLIEHIKEYDRPFKMVFISSIKRLIIPYFLFQFLYTVWFCLKNGFHNLKWMLMDIVLLIDWDYASWFLLTLFLSKVFVIALRKIIKNPFASNAIISTVFLAGLFVDTVAPSPDISLYRHLIRALVAMGFICLGIILYKYKESFKSPAVLFISLFASLFTAYANGLVSSFFLAFGNPFLYIASALFGAVFVLSLSNHIKIRFIEFFGRESVIALGVHQLILRSFPFENILLWFVVTPITALIMFVCKTVRIKVKSKYR